MLSASNKFSFIMQNELSLQGIVMFIYENDLNQYVLFITRTNFKLNKRFSVSKCTGYSFDCSLFI